jgi:hypothetical protein
MRKSLAQAIEDRIEAFVSEPICVLRNAERRLIELGGGDGTIAVLRQLTPAHCGANHLVGEVVRAFARSDWRVGGGACRHTSPVCSYWKRGHGSRIGPLRLKPTPLSSEQYQEMRVGRTDSFRLRRFRIMDVLEIIPHNSKKTVFGHKGYVVPTSRWVFVVRNLLFFPRNPFH